MTARDRQIAAFLAGAGWADADRRALAGDASARRYDRLTDGRGHAAVLMIAPPEDAAGITTFQRLADHLAAAGLSAPRILAADADTGLMLLEDLGDDTFTRLIARAPAREPDLYAAATDLLAELRAMDRPEGLVTLDPVTLAGMTDLAFTRYAAPITGADATPRILPRLEDLFHDALRGPAVFLHRDYHADNLLWLPDRTGPARVGLLDFQDAVAGPEAYDLVSLLQDARRDVPAAVEIAMTARFRDTLGQDDHTFRTAYAVLGLQRNLRILGVFARLACDFGKPRYLDLMPRVFGHVERNLDHPALAPVAQAILDALPRPTPATLSRLLPRTA
ncbi:aminoglycoside phosphotransferase family protein [Marinibacterium sp. SX1]|uniref:aminoglycoside phosphotransferase family protein n=1 Tax=Marinibacterium sp. SX1 TaxID=3388424 RepID=UPI003D1668A9